MTNASTLFAAAGVSLGLLVSINALAADRNPVGISPQIEVAAIPAPVPVETAAAANCLLPGQIHNFGGVTLLMPKRAVTLEPADCVARGGDPTIPPSTN